MTGIPTCLPPVRETRRPRLDLPVGATDTHTHVFESKYPLSPNRGYNPPDSTLEDLQTLHGVLGIDRVVLTQPSVYGTDNSAILDAVAAMPERSRAVVAIGSTINAAELEDLHRRGARGIRLNLDNQGGMPMSLADVGKVAAAIEELGWHIEFLFAGHDLPDLVDLIRSLPVPVCIAHFAYMPAGEGVEYPPFRLLVELVREGNTWIKLSAPNRLGVGDLPPWDAVVPLAHTLLEADPDRMLWGSDWPHPNKFETQPNDADLLEQLELWAPSPELRRRVLVDNPAALYGFDS